MTMSPENSPRAVTQAYFGHWTAGRFGAAADFLADDIVVETPINSYPGKADFVAALSGFGALVKGANMLVDLAEGDDVVQIYDMDVPGLGVIRMTEHFVIRLGLITRLRQIHDTAALRAAGFDRGTS